MDKTENTSADIINLALCPSCHRRVGVILLGRISNGYAIKCHRGHKEIVPLEDPLAQTLIERSAHAH